MKRKFISYDSFENIKNSATSSVEKELLESKTIIADTLNLPNINLSFYDKDHVVYESYDGTYVSANYVLTKDRINLNNIEQLVLNEETETQHAKNLLSQLMDCVLDNEESKANELFTQYVNLPLMKRKFNENSIALIKSKKNKFENTKLNAKKIVRENYLLKFKNNRDKFEKINEWKNLSKNVSSLLKYNNVNSLIKEANIKRDEKNNIIALSIPNISTKNETKISCLKNYHENSLMKTERNNAKKLHENSDFVASISLIKKLNNLMDNQLEEAIEETVSRWPNLIYLTKNELSNIIETSLESAGITSFDDKLCDEISESLLKSAHLAYTEKTEAIINSSGKSIKNTYEEFSELTKDYFPHLDESAALEMQSYVDLYEALKHVYSISLNEGMKKSTYAVLSDLSAVIEQKIDPDYEILENAVELLNNYIETNLNPQDWVVSNDVHVSLTGENPVLAQKAKQSYSPANDLEGDGYKDTAPVGDGETYSGDLAKTMRNNSWGNHKNDAWPNLSNPYVPKPFGSYKIKDETAIEDDKSLVDQGGNDVWPNLNNPYVK